MLKGLINIKDGNYNKDPDIFYVQARKALIESKERDVTVTIDGEPMGLLPASFEILKKALTTRK